MIVNLYNVVTVEKHTCLKILKTQGPKLISLNYGMFQVFIHF